MAREVALIDAVVGPFEAALRAHAADLLGAGAGFETAVDLDGWGTSVAAALAPVGAVTVVTEAAEDVGSVPLRGDRIAATWVLGRAVVSGLPDAGFGLVAWLALERARRWPLADVAREAARLRGPSGHVVFAVPADLAGTASEALEAAGVQGTREVALGALIGTYSGDGSGVVPGGDGATLAEPPPYALVGTAALDGAPTTRLRDGAAALRGELALAEAFGPAAPVPTAPVAGPEETVSVLQREVDRLYARIAELEAALPR